VFYVALKQRDNLNNARAAVLMSLHVAGGGPYSLDRLIGKEL
jgi:hypothetical protein